jgi:hypothetical protein
VTRRFPERVKVILSNQNNWGRTLRVQCLWKRGFPILIVALHKSEKRSQGGGISPRALASRSRWRQKYNAAFQSKFDLSSGIPFLYFLSEGSPPHWFWE